MKIFFQIFAFLLSSSAIALEFNSGEKKVHLIELYTSQSCSSCPPAERKISEYRNHEKLFKEFIPLAFHVTYWNYLSWRDQFSKQIFSNRQRDYSRITNSGVYTPQIVLDGVDFRSWRGSNIPSLFKKNVKAGNLNVEINKSMNQTKFTFISKEYEGNLTCYASLIENR